MLINYVRKGTFIVLSKGLGFMNKDTTSVLLMILDGFGFRKDSHGNAILKAKMPNYMHLWNSYPHTVLEASGMSVGLPDGQMGNSEVGHLNIGSGRVVYQDLSLISRAVDTGDFFENKAILSAINHVKKNDSKLHLYGLLSDGGVHSHITHLFALLDLAKKHGLKKVYVHCFMDGRDTPPTSGINYIKHLEDYMKKNKIGKIATISGRYYAMDRDNRWERVEKAYNAMVHGDGNHTDIDAENAALCTIENSYQNGITDEFILPTVIDEDGLIGSNDSIIMFNYRPDRAREITRAFVDSDYVGFGTSNAPKNISYVCMTQYDETMPNVSVAYPPQQLQNTLGEYISSKGLNQLRIAETEKYAHVTFFFNGGVEKPNDLEDRILVPSPKVDTYDMKPEMSSDEVTERLLSSIDENKYNLIILNFANPDMVGHTGNLDATVSALEHLDKHIGRIVEKFIGSGGHVLITADHGNSDYMLDENDAVVTSHSLSPVPLIYVTPASFSGDISLRDDGILADIAPTILDILKLEKPAEMTGKTLII